MKLYSKDRSFLLLACLMAFVSGCNLINQSPDSPSLSMLIQTDRTHYLLNEDKFVTIEQIRNDSMVPVYMQALIRAKVKLEKKTEDENWEEIKGWWNYEIVTYHMPFLAELLPGKELPRNTESSFIPKFSVDKDIGSPGEYRIQFFIYDSKFDIHRGESGSEYLLPEPYRITNTFYILNS